MVKCPGDQDNENSVLVLFWNLENLSIVSNVSFFQNPGNKRGQAISTSKINLRTFLRAIWRYGQLALPIFKTFYDKLTHGQQVVAF